MKDLTVWNTIKATLKREGKLKNGRYERATFNVGNFNYEVIAEVRGDNGEVESGLFRNGVRYKGGRQVNGVIPTGYRKVHIVGTGVIFEHVLIAMALNPEIQEIMESDVKNTYTINHKRIRRRDKEARDKKKELFRVFDSLIDSGYDFSSASAITGCYDYNVPDKVNFIDDLEVCTRADNTRHAHIVEVYNLYDISISSKQAIELKEQISNSSEVKNLVKAYLENHSIK